VVADIVGQRLRAAVEDEDPGPRVDEEVGRLKLDGQRIARTPLFLERLFAHGQHGPETAVVQGDLPKVLHLALHIGLPEALALGLDSLRAPQHVKGVVDGVAAHVRHLAPPGSCRRVEALGPALDNVEIRREGHAEGVVVADYLPPLAAPHLALQSVEGGESLDHRGIEDGRPLGAGSGHGNGSRDLPRRSGGVAQGLVDVERFPPTGGQLHHRGFVAGVGGDGGDVDAGVRGDGGVAVGQVQLHGLAQLGAATCAGLVPGHDTQPRVALQGAGHAGAVSAAVAEDADTVYGQVSGCHVGHHSPQSTRNRKRRRMREMRPSELS